jgi:hypothetical protein
MEQGLNTLIGVWGFGVRACHPEPRSFGEGSIHEFKIEIEIEIEIENLEFTPQYFNRKEKLNGV